MLLVRSSTVPQNSVIQARSDGKRIRKGFQALLQYPAKRSEIISTLKKFTKYRNRERISAAHNFAKDKPILPVPTKDVREARKTTSRETSQQQDLIFRTYRVGVIFMSAKPFRPSHPGGVSNVKTCPRMPTDSFMTIRCKTNAECAAISVENNHAAPKQD